MERIARRPSSSSTRSPSAGRFRQEYIRRSARASPKQMQNGVVAGYPLIGVGDAQRRLLPGRRIDGDGLQDRRLHGAARRRAAPTAPVLLEPIMKVEVVTPEDYMGDVVGDLNRRRGVDARVWKRSGNTQDRPGRGAAVGDVRLRHGPAFRDRRGARRTRWSSRSTSRCRDIRSVSRDRILTPTIHRREGKQGCPRRNSNVRSRT